VPTSADFHPCRFAAAAALAWLPCAPSAWAQAASAPPSSAASAAEATRLAPLTNAATRTDRRIDTVPATVTVKTAREAEARAARDLKDLLRTEVDLGVRQQPGRFTAAGSNVGRAGQEGLNVRGLEGNQVMLLVDGIRAPQSYSFGAFASGRLDTLFTEALAQVEVLRGPASAQFGSDGLAGALSLRTLEPADLLAPGRAQAGFVRTGLHSVDDGALGTAALAGRQGGISWLALASHRAAHELDNQGRDASLDSRRTEPNPLDLGHSGALAKIRWAATPAHGFGATLETVRRTSSSDVISARSVPSPAPAPTAVLGLVVNDRQERSRLSLDWQYDELNAPLVQKAEARLYAQDTQVRQEAFEDRVGIDRVRDGRYRERLLGLSALASGSLPGSFGGALSQRLSAGLDASENRISALRDGTVPPFGERFPSKPFPDTRYRLVGGFVQSEIEAGRLSVMPALRFDRYELEADPAGYTASTVVSMADQAFTPRLGLVWSPGEAFKPYAQWARGYRAPAPDQVNNGFSNPASGYRSIGNAALRAERAESLELGLRGAAFARRLSWQVAVYDNRYRDFISQQVVGGAFTPADPAVFQFINLAQARIRGLEARIEATPAAGWTLQATYAAARGDSEAGGVTTPLATVEPARWHLGVARQRGVLGWRADLVHAAAKASSRLPAATDFATPAYTTLDLGASWQATKQLVLHLALDNVTDETYWRWGDARSLTAASPIKDVFTAPGRSVSLVARYDF
jgi:hemoglobin/transferrin/lactoferrin receptor protein